MTVRTQVAVLGLGPAGRATAHRLAAAGVDVVAVDASPDRRWTPTYAAWEDELPAWLTSGVVATRTAHARAWAVREHRLDRTYVVLDTPGLQRSLDLGSARVLPGSVVDAGARRVRLADGSAVEADLVLDARGTRPSPERAAQTAYGLVVPTERAAAAGGPWFMDWRRDHGAGPGAAPSFLYAVPLGTVDGTDRTLLEETCLVGRPALGLDELRRRLEHRLAARGVGLTGDEPVERVRFSVEAEPGGPGRTRRAPGDRPVALGARAGVMHPATGYSVAVSLRLAEEVAQAVAGGRDVWDVLWPSRARRVQRLREMGLTTLLRLPPAGVERFFAAFFALPPARQRAYLTDRTDPAGTLAAMARMARTLPPGLSAVAVGSGPCQDGRDASTRERCDMELDLSGRVVVVTGAARGIGRVITETFLRERSVVVGVDVTTDGLGWLDDAGGTGLACDVTDGDATRALVTEVVARFGRVDVLVNNAGVNVEGTLEELGDDDWDRCFAVNVGGVFKMCRAVAPVMKAQRSGRIVNAASFAAIVPSVGAGAYAASKAAVVQLTRTLAGELGPWDVTANAYAPGMVPTAMNGFAELAGPAQDRLLDTLTLRRWEDPQEVADVVVFLASDAARYVTGTLLDVSGGKLATQLPQKAYERAAAEVLRP